MTYVMRSTQAAKDARTVYPIETMRGIAVLMLVSFHVIGASGGSGLELRYPSPFRMFADYLVDVRMPLFAFIAGYVYGLRPVTLDGFEKFLSGKFYRLVVPGVIAITLFAALATAMGTVFAVTPTTLWEIYLFPYAHYWFLQAILLIFLVYGLCDALLKNRGVLVFLLLACWLFLEPKLPVNFFSVNSAVLLAPFFLLGLAMIRYADHIARRWPAYVALSLIVVVIGTWQHCVDLIEHGSFSRQRRDFHSLYYGLSVCMLLALVLPRIRVLEWIGPFAFTIYLYHVFGTAAIRRVLYALDVTSIPLHYVIGLAAGILLPVALHLMVDRSALLRRYMLGLRRPRSA